ncbi:FeoA family protein [Desulfotomaculum sp. 1211_IL3151]|uniref:FeoA family protein n=1 Tax=Desulfotomaculum sp. 1211_IL3151 TaxID=3084055 RepID=UPI002FD90136
MLKPLSSVKKGRIVHIQDICGCPKRKLHLEEMGFTCGCPVEVCKCNCNGPLVVAVRGSKIMIGHEMAQQIMVR